METEIETVKILEGVIISQTIQISPTFPIVFCGLLIVTGLIIFIYSLFSRSQIERKLNSYEFSPAVLNKMSHKYPGMTSKEMNMCIAGLKSYFNAIQTNKKGLGMPSVMVDSLWHEFILDTKNYIAFCRSLGVEYIHHNPGTPIFKTDFSSDYVDSEMLRTFDALYKNNGQLPLLFEIDSLCGLKDGFKFDIVSLVQQSRKEEDIKKSVTFY